MITPSQTSLFYTTVDNELINNTLSMVTEYIDSVTWMVLFVGPLTYCEKCLSDICRCGKFTPLWNQEKLKICDRYTNSNDSIQELIKLLLFPNSTIFVTKDREFSKLHFKMVVRRKNREYFLKAMKLKDIREIVPWKEVFTIIQNRLEYENRRKCSCVPITSKDIRNILGRVNK